jgi:rhodanese-related sulfurtransferase
MERTLPHSKFEIETFRIAIRRFSRFALGLFAAWLLLSTPVLAAKHSKDSLEIVQNRVTEKKAVLIDVREEKEWKQGHLKAAKLLPLSHLERGMSTEKLKEFMPKDKIVYLHCASGARCIEAAELLTDLGFEVRPLEPRYDAFIEAGFEEVIP